MKRNKMISAAMCAVMFATSTVLYVSAAPKYNTAPASVQSNTGRKIATPIRS